MPLEPRRWQQAFLDKYAAFQPENFLLVACPAAGKTHAAGFLARDLLHSGLVERVLILVHTVALRAQWTTKMRDHGLNLDGASAAGPWGEMASLGGLPTHGWVVTYQSLCATEEAVQDHAELCRKRPTLAILDEVHHLGDDSRWGASAQEALGPCVRRLGLSGTPFRHRSPIPFFEMVRTSGNRWESRYRDDGDGTPYPAAFDYSYGAALADRPSPVRPVVFEHYDGDVEWLDGHSLKVVKRRISDDVHDKKLRGKINRHALNADGDWLRAVLVGADMRLSELRADGDGRAKGLVVCRDIQHADEVAARLKEIVTEPVYLAVSDEPGSSEIISSFGSSNARWLVAVQMVTEGIDIPELRVEVYATTIRAELFFTQVTARVLRRRADLPPGLDQTAHVFIPKEPRMLELAEALQEEVRRAILDEEDDAFTVRENETAAIGRTLSLFTDDFRSSSADNRGILVPGHGDLGLSVELIESMASQFKRPVAATSEILSTLLRNGWTPPGGPFDNPAEPHPTATPIDPQLEIKRLKGRLDEMIKQLTTAEMRRQGLPHSEFSSVISRMKSEIYHEAGIYSDAQSHKERRAAYGRADTPALGAAIRATRKRMTEFGG